MAKVHTLLFVEETEKLHGISEWNVDGKMQKLGPGIQSSIVTHLTFWRGNSRSCNILVEGRKMVREKLILIKDLLCRTPSRFIVSS